MYRPAVAAADNAGWGNVAAAAAADGAAADDDGDGGGRGESDGCSDKMDPDGGTGAAPALALVLVLVTTRRAGVAGWVAAAAARVIAPAICHRRCVWAMAVRRVSDATTEPSFYPLLYEF